MDPTDTGEMIVKRVSVPIGLEELMEGLVKEVLLKKPDDIYFFAAKYFSQLLLRRDNGQTKVKTIRSAQSLTDQREKRFQTKIPVSGVTKQLSRQFSIRGESPMRNFDSPIISQKPKMYDRSESKYKRRNTGPPTIPENHINNAVRKKYSRSVSTERKRETEHSVGSTKRSTNKKGAKEMQDESNEKLVRNKNGDKRNSVTKELQKNTSLVKSIPTSQVERKFLEQKNISEKDNTVEDSKSVNETADLIGSAQSNREIQITNENIQASTELLVQDDLGLLSEKTAAPIENNNLENSKRESEDGNNILRENVVDVPEGIKNDGSADRSINKNNDVIEGIMNRNDDDEKPQSMEHPSKNSDEVLKVDPKMDTSSEKSKSPTDTLDNLTMESENAEESRSVSVNSYENEKDTTKNAGANESKLTHEDLNTVKEDSKATEEKNGQHEPDAITNGSDKTEEILGDDKKPIDTEIFSKEASDKSHKENLPFLMNTNGERSGNLKTGSKSEQLLLDNISTTNTETHGTDIDPEPSIGNQISYETNIDSSYKNEVNESIIKTDQRGDCDNKEIGEDNQRENVIDKKVDDDIDRVTEKENINKEGHDVLNDLHNISVNDDQEKTSTEIPSEHKIMSSEINLQTTIEEHDSNGETVDKVASNKGEDSEKRGVNDISGKGTDHSSSESEIIGTISNDGVDMKNGSERSQDDVIINKNINKKSTSTENSKNEGIDLLEESLKQPSMEHEGIVMDSETSEIKASENSSNENKKVEKKEHESNDQQLKEEQSNIDGALKETTNSLSDKEHCEIVANEAKNVSETDKPLENIPSRKEPSEMFHNRPDKAENHSVSKNAPVEDEKLTKELSEDNSKNNEEKDIPDTNSTADKESFSNTGNDSISRNESAGNEEIIKKDSSKARDTFDSLKAPYISDSQSYKNSNDKFIVSDSSDNLGVEQTGSETAKMIKDITENSELKNDVTTLYVEENKVESCHKTEKLPINMSDDIDTNGKGKADKQKLKEHQDEQSADSTGLKNIDPSTGQSEIDRNHKHPLHDSNVVREDILIQKGDNIKIDTTEGNNFFANSSKENEIDEISEKPLMQNVKEKQEELSSTYKNLNLMNETKTVHSNAIRNDINPSEVTENIVTHKDMVKLNNSNSVAEEEKEKLDEEMLVSIKDYKTFERNAADITEKINDITISKTNDEHDHSSAIDGSSGPEQNSNLENSKLEQKIDCNEDVANILNGPNQSQRSKRSLEEENEFSKHSQNFDTDSNSKSEHESSSDTKEIEESNTETHSGDPKINHEISQPVDETESKNASDSNANDEKQEVTDTSDNKTNVGIIDKVAKNYISYVIDKENFLKYNHADNDGNEDGTPNITNGIGDDMPKNTSNQQHEFDENSDIQKNSTDNQTSFDRSKLREELGIPSTEEPINSEREELKRNISSTLSIAETGLIDIPVKTFINNFINTERANNDEYKKTQSTAVESKEIIAGSGDNKKDANPNEFKINESFDRSKLRKELQKIEHESKFTSFKQSFNSSLLRQELEHAALLKKSTKNNGYSSTLAKAAAVVRIQSMWRGFIVRKSFPKPQYEERFSVHRDENSNVSQEKIKAIESKLSTSSTENKGNNEEPKLMEAVSTIQRCWRGFKVRKHLNSMRLRQNSLESARIKRHVDSENIDFFDTMRAAVKIQKMWRGFITRKKLNIGKECEDEKVVDETNGKLIQKQILPSVNTEKSHTTESHESIPKTDYGINVKQIESQMLQMKNDDNGNNEGSKIVPGSESNMHGKLTSLDNSKTEKTPNCSAQKSIDDQTRFDYATKIQSLWRGFLVRKYVKQLKKQMENKRDGGTHITDEGNFPKDEPQRPGSIDSNDSSNTVIFNDVNKKSEEGVKTHDDHLLGYAMNHRDFDDVDASLDEILEYPLIKDENLIDDYQNELLDRISGKQKVSGDAPDETVGTVSSKRIEEIKAEDLRDIGALHTSLLSNGIGQDRTESQVEQIHPRSKLESVIEESPSPTAEDPIDSKTEQPNGMATTTTEKEGVDDETEKSKLSFCSEPSAAPCELKLIEGKPLSDYVEDIKTESFSSREHSTSGQIENDDNDVIEHTHSDVEPAGKIDSANFISNHVVQHTVQESADREFESASDENASDLKNVKLLHSGEWHDSIVVPLSKILTESLSSDTHKGRIGHFQDSEASEKSLDSTADLSSILSNSSAGLLHTGEMHDGIVVPISLSSLQRTISSGGENDGIDTVDSHTQAVQNPGIQTTNNTTNGASSVAVRVLQAPEPEVLTSPKPITAAGDVTRAAEGRTAQTPNKEDLRIQSELSPSVSHSMESEGAGKTEEKNMEAQAATKIQAGFRGYQVRKQLKLKNGSSDMNPPKRQCRGKGPGRSDSAKSQTNRPKDVEEKSAVKIQAGVRGFLVRRRQKKQSNQES